MKKKRRKNRIAFDILQFKEDFRSHPGSPKSPRITVYYESVPSNIQSVSCHLQYDPCVFEFVLKVECFFFFIIRSNSFQIFAIITRFVINVVTFLITLNFFDIILLGNAN